MLLNCPFVVALKVVMDFPFPVCTSAYEAGEITLSVLYRAPLRIPLFLLIQCDQNQSLLVGLIMLLF